MENMEKVFKSEWFRLYGGDFPLGGIERKGQGKWSTYRVFGKNHHSLYLQRYSEFSEDTVRVYTLVQTQYNIKYFPNTLYHQAQVLSTTIKRKK